VINVLESIRCRFFWGFKESQPGFYWVNGFSKEILQLSQSRAKRGEGAKCRDKATEDVTSGKAFASNPNDFSSFLKGAKPFTL
ncbi:hypothetical protein Tco_1340214, partial [Tanacetum coccineum]